jgi:hypothetical protein
MILITRIDLLEGKGVVGVALEEWREGSLFQFRGRLVEVVVVVDKAVLDRLDFGLAIIGECYYYYYWCLCVCLFTCLYCAF